MNITETRIAPFYDEDGITIYNADYRSLVGSIEAGSIITSPPYGVGKEYEDGGQLEWLATVSRLFSVGSQIVVVNTAKVRTRRDPILPMVRAESQKKHPVTFADVVRVIQSGVSAKDEIAKNLGCSEQTVERRLVGNNSRGGKTEPQTCVFDLSAECDRLARIGGYYLHDSRVWIKDPCWQSCQWHPISDRAVDEFEDIQVFVRSGTILKQDRNRLTSTEWAEWGSRSVWSIASVRKNDIHPAMYPIELARRMVRLWGRGVVLDPFMGSGTTLLAAKLEGRKAVGIEISEKYCEVAVDRLGQKVLF